MMELCKPPLIKKEHANKFIAWFSDTYVTNKFDNVIVSYFVDVLAYDLACFGDFAGDPRRSAFSTDYNMSTTRNANAIGTDLILGEDGPSTCIYVKYESLKPDDCMKMLRPFVQHYVIKSGTTITAKCFKYVCSFHCNPNNNGTHKKQKTHKHACACPSTLNMIVNERGFVVLVIIPKHHNHDHDHWMDARQPLHPDLVNFILTVSIEGGKTYSAQSTHILHAARAYGKRIWQKEVGDLNSSAVFAEVSNQYHPSARKIGSLLRKIPLSSWMKKYPQTLRNLFLDEAGKGATVYYRPHAREKLSNDNVMIEKISREDTLKLDVRMIPPLGKLWTKGRPPSCFEKGTQITVFPDDPNEKDDRESYGLSLQREGSPTVLVLSNKWYGCKV